jgi:hypothetical protein
MKISIVYIFLAVSMLVACRKEDNPKLPDLTRVPVPLVVKDAAGDFVISAQNPGEFNGKFTVDLFFETDVKPQKFDVVMIKNGDKSRVVTIQENVTTFPTTIDITGDELIAASGEPIETGDAFDISVDITMQNGQVLKAFPNVGTTWGPGVLNQPGASTNVRYEAVCQFDASAYAGDFEVLVDEWEDYPPGTVIPVTVINDHQISFEYAAADPKPIIVNVDLATNVTSVVKQEYGNYGGTVVSVESAAGNDNFVAPCEGVISVKLTHSFSGGDIGTFIIKLKKKG